ncbi:UNVERIFIED_CONTAM: hypothetical protein FKN15_044998 [Acipenser sinensis]
MANYLLWSAHRYHPCAVLRSVCRQANRFFSHCRLTMQPPKSYSIGGQRSSRAATGKPTGARPDYRGRWCAVGKEWLITFPAKSRHVQNVTHGTPPEEEVVEERPSPEEGEEARAYSTMGRSSALSIASVATTGIPHTPAN